ncbi:response regulator [Bacteriovoracaceae bacterium]|nr:response regulator [Bacteriovoracaceae bacterium]
MSSKFFLIVDDDPNSATLYKEIILGLDEKATVIVANDGIDGTRKLSNQKFDVVITDLSMPRKNGVALIEEIIDKKYLPKRNIIVVSGAMDAENVQRFAELGVKNVCTKPINVENLETIIDRLNSNS